MVVLMVAFMCLGRVSALAELASMSMACRKILGYEVGGDPVSISLPFGRTQIL